MEHFRDHKANLEKILELQAQFDPGSIIWLQTTKSALSLLENPKIHQTLKKKVSIQLSLVTSNYILSPIFKSENEKVHKLILNVCMSLLQVTISEFDTIYAESKARSQPYNFFSLLARSVLLKIQKDLNVDLSDYRLKDHLMYVLTKFDFKPLSFLQNLINIDLDPEKSLSTPYKKVKNLINKLFSDRKNIKFFQRLNFLLCDSFERLQSEGFELNEANLNLIVKCEDKEWNINKFGLDSENSRFDRIATIGSSPLSDIYIPSSNQAKYLKALSCMFVYSNSAFYILGTGDNVKFYIEQGQRLKINNGFKIEIRENCFVEFFDLENLNITVKESGNECEVRFEKTESGVLVMAKCESGELRFFVNREEEGIFFWFEGNELQPWVSGRVYDDGTERFWMPLNFWRNLMKIDNCEFRIEIDLVRS